ncbi:MAG: thaumatin family protein, partial [Spirochaetales bacterium]|nr:thaumatin family protein [Spirochaetales bacterium]
MTKKIFAVLLLALLMLTTFDLFSRNFILRNRTGRKITVRYLCGATGATKSWTIAAGTEVTHSVANGTAAMRYWVDTGDNSPPCNTLSEFTLNGAGGLDYYDVSLVDGFNVAMRIRPINASAGNGTKYSCGMAGCLSSDVIGKCPAALRKGKACCSACQIFGSPQYCCSGAYNTPATCPPTNYSNYFKQKCPNAYSYAY